jgi:hypothetical protein
MKVAVELDCVDQVRGSIVAIDRMLAMLAIADPDGMAFHHSARVMVIRIVVHCCLSLIVSIVALVNSVGSFVVQILAVA